MRTYGGIRWEWEYGWKLESRVPCFEVFGFFK